MSQVRPIFMKLLVLAIIVFVIGVSIMLSDLYFKQGRTEHTLLHHTGKH